MRDPQQIAEMLRHVLQLPNADQMWKIGAGGKMGTRVGPVGFVRGILPAMLALLFSTAAGAAYAQDALATNAAGFVDLTGGRALPGAAPPVAQDGFVDLTDGKPLPGAAENQPDRMTIGNLTIVGSYDPALPLSVDLTATPGDHIVIEAPKPKPPALAPVGPDPNDPFEETNRGAFASHMALHRNVIVPVEDAYADVVPEVVRASIHHFLLNLEFPAIFINDSLQLSPGRAVTTMARFVINSTVGVGGLLDPATSFGLPFRDNDFGATLANYGVGDYPYLMVPVIGPTNPRDLTGKVVDIFLNPVHYVAVPGGILTDAAENGVRELDGRAANYEELEHIGSTDKDPYVTVRRLSRERRNAEITSGQKTDNGR